MTDKPWTKVVRKARVVRYFEDDRIDVISREENRSEAERIMMEWNDHGYSTDVEFDPHNLWIVPDETHWRQSDG